MSGRGRWESGDRDRWEVEARSGIGQGEVKERSINAAIVPRDSPPRRRMCHFPAWSAAAEGSRVPGEFSGRFRLFSLSLGVTSCYPDLLSGNTQNTPTFNVHSHNLQLPLHPTNNGTIVYKQLLIVVKITLLIYRSGNYNFHWLVDNILSAIVECQIPDWEETY